MKKVIGYVRAQTRKEQRLQWDAIDTWCMENDAQAEMMLDAERGGSFGRIAFGDWLRGKKYDAVVVADSDLVSTDPMEFYAYKSVLKRRHCDLVAVKSEFSGAYKLYESILGKFVDVLSRVELENEPIRKPHDRMDKAARGEYIGGNPPMGYMVQDGKLVINPEEAPAVEVIMAQKKQGKTMLGTVELLNARGYKTRRGRPFVISTVQSIWNNEPFYRGMYRYGKDGEWVKGQHEPILKG